MSIDNKKMEEIIRGGMKKLDYIEFGIVSRKSALDAVTEAVKESLKTVENEVKKYKSVKIFEKILPNGNVEIRKVNKNGALMVKEVTPAGKNVFAEVTTLDGSQRKITYSPQTGKPLNTFSNLYGGKLSI